MNDSIAWLIALAFFAPLHYLGPLLVALLSGNEPAPVRKRLLVKLALDCTLSMALAFAIAAWTFNTLPGVAISALIAAMLTPYLHLWLYRRRHPSG